MDSGRTRTARLLLIVGAASLFGVGASPNAIAEDKVKATTLVQQADHLLDQAGCFRADRVRTGCGDPAIFKDAAAKYDQAVRLYPSPKAAFLACKLHNKAQGPDLEWSKSSGKFLVALARCDYAAFHPETRDEIRTQARSVGEEMRSELRIGGDKEAYDRRVTAAAKALYGGGLTMKYDKGAAKITLDYGEVDAEALERYTSEFYAGYAPKVLNEGVGMGFFLEESRADEYRALLEKGVLGWVLLEPRAKFRICKQMVKRMNRFDRALEHWCLYQSVIEANAPRFGFRGTRVTWNAKDTEGGGVSYSDRIFLPTIDGAYEPTITIAGPIEIDDRKHVEYLLRVANDVKGSYAHYQDTLALKARAEKIVEQKEAALAKVEKKLRARKGNVIFSEQTFKSWTLPELLAKGATADCDKLHYKVYAPTARGDYDAELKVDGETCNIVSVWTSEDVGAFAESLMHPFAAKDDGCPKALLVPGEHEVVVNVHTLKAMKTGYKKITRDWKIKDEYMGYWGKKVGTWTAKCATQGSGSGARFE